MSAIIVPRRWTQQPTGPVEIDWTHPLTIMLQEALHPTFQFDCVRKIPLLDPGTTSVAKVAAKFGLARQFGVNSRYSTGELNRLSDAVLPRTLFFQHQNTGAGANNRFMWRGASGGSLTTANEAVGCNVGPVYQYARRVSSVDVGSSNWAATLDNGSNLVITNDGATAANTELYENGVKQTRLGTSAFSISGNAALTNKIYLGSSATGGSGGQATKMSLCLIWTRILSLAEIKEISRNPWQIFKPISTRIYIDAAAAGGGFLAAWARNRSQVIGAGAH